jgi:integrase
VRILVNYLQKRGNRYFFRLAIPADVRQHYDGRREVTKALGTEDQLVAAPEALKMGESYLAEFARHRGLEPVCETSGEVPERRLPESKVIELTDMYALEMVEKVKRDGVDWSDYEAIGLGKTRAEQVEEGVGLGIDDLQDGLRMNPSAWLESNRLGMECRRKWGQWLAAKGCAELTEAEWTTVCALFIDAECTGLALIRDMGVEQLAEVGTYQRLKRRLEQGTQVAPVIAQVVTPEGEPEDTSPLFSECAQLWIDTAKENDSAAGDKQNLIRFFTAWAGDRPIASYVRPDAKGFRDQLLVKLPTRASMLLPKDKAPTKRTLLALVNDKANIGGKVRETISSKTITKYTAFLFGIFKHALTEGLLPGGFNPASGLALKESKAEKKKRQPYNPDQLQRLVDELGRRKRADSRYWRDWQAWIPVVALYQGMRQNEVAQLCVSDVRKVGSIWCLDLNENRKEETHKSLKTDESWRVIPIHPEIVRLGFLDLHARAAAGVAELETTNLWHRTGLKRLEGQHWGRAVTTWFQNFSKRFLTPDEHAKARSREHWLDFHSLRHTFGSFAYNQAEMKDVERQTLMGHTPPGIGPTNRVYIGAKEANRLYRELSKLDYGLDLSPLAGLV